MFKKLFFVILCSVFSLPSKANTTSNTPYKDYIDCYYELEQAQDLNNTLFVGQETFSDLRQNLQKWGNDAAKEMVRITDYDAYVFSYEGLFGIKVNEQENICSKFVGMEGYDQINKKSNDTCAIDLKTKAGNNAYNLCYVKTWLGENKKGNTYSENIYDGSCTYNDVTPTKPVMSTLNQLTLQQLITTNDLINDLITQNLHAEQLDSNFFALVLYPILQNKYSAFAYDFINENGFKGYLCTDSNAKAKFNRLIGQESQSQKDNVKFKKSYKERTLLFNKIVSSDQCYSACKKLGIITKIKN